MPGRYVAPEKTLNGCASIPRGEFDDVDEGRLYMIGVAREATAAASSAASPE
jgi:F0F1-type ATP synthase beta subunit